MFCFTRDNWVFDFPFDFFRRRSWLWAMVYVFTLCMEIVQVLLWALGKAIWRLCGDRTEIVQCKCSCSAVSTDSAQKSYSACVGSAQGLHGDVP